MELDLKVETDCSDNEIELSKRTPISTKVTAPPPKSMSRVKRELSTSSEDFHLRFFEEGIKITSKPKFTKKPRRIKEDLCELYSQQSTSPTTSCENSKGPDVKFENSEEYSDRDECPAKINASLKELRKERSTAQSKVSGEKRRLKALHQHILDKDLEIQRQTYKIEDFSEIKNDVLRKWQTAKRVKVELVKEKSDAETKLHLAKEIRQRDEEALKELTQKIFHLEEKLQHVTSAKVVREQFEKRRTTPKKRLRNAVVATESNFGDLCEQDVYVPKKPNRMIGILGPLQFSKLYTKNTSAQVASGTKSDGTSLDKTKTKGLLLPDSNSYEGLTPTRGSRRAHFLAEPVCEDI